MSDKPKNMHIFAESGRLIVLAVTAGILAGIVGPASAQFFNFGAPRGQQQRAGGGFGENGWFGGHSIFAPFHQPAPEPHWTRRHTLPLAHQDFSRAPAAENRQTLPERSVLVLGDSMAGWLAYGLEEAYAEQLQMGVIRKHKTLSGLIKYQAHGDPADWSTVAKGILAADKPDAIVIMLGLADRVAIREPSADQSDNSSDNMHDNVDAGAKTDAKLTDAKPDAKPHRPADGAAKPEKNAINTDLTGEDANNADAPVIAPKKSARSPNGLYEFREERWVELYTKKIQEMIAVVKSKGAPVIWVGLPAIRGAKGTADMLFLDSLYRDAAAEASITYVDVWDGFVDEAGRFLQKGPDFEGQIRQLRSDDGVYFTKRGARKLAHYAEREITRIVAARSTLIALPAERATPDAGAIPGQSAPRPLAGPIVPLVASFAVTDRLLGGPDSLPAAVDALAARTLVKGEALIPPAGRADDFAWPRREVGREQAKGDARSHLAVQ
jgi:uncharacterized protein